MFLSFCGSLLFTLVNNMSIHILHECSTKSGIIGMAKTNPVFWGGADGFEGSSDVHAPRFHGDGAHALLRHLSGGRPLCGVRSLARSGGQGAERRSQPATDESVFQCHHHLVISRTNKDGG